MMLPPEGAPTPCFRIGAATGWDWWLQLVLPRRRFAEHVAKKLAGRFRSFQLPDGSLWRVNGVDAVEEIT